jgi:hypothetical protein
MKNVVDHQPSAKTTLLHDPWQVTDGHDETWMADADAMTTPARPEKASSDSRKEPFWLLGQIGGILQ